MNEHPQPSSGSGQEPEGQPESPPSPPPLPHESQTVNQSPSTPPPYPPDYQSPSTPMPNEPPANPFIESGKAAMSDAASVVKRLQKDPTQGLQAALDSLGDQRAFNVGLLLGGLFVFFSWGAAWRVSNDIFRFFTFSLSRFSTGSDFRPQLGVADHLKIIIVSALPFLAAVGVLIAIQKLFKSRGNSKQMVFIAGICFLPVAILQLLIMVFGAGNIEFLLILILVVFTTTVLLINTALIDVLKLSSRTAMILVPAILLVIFYVQKLLLESILTP
ncbi:Yip1 family protein [Acaryochloris sp. IP29b_bin.137]|uniref:Yip1 family protein n=1 Tax=Acaryochloris sp. IP29b_bin.137 TaxID=2969217 RepID=UPI00261205EB|nr:Yip1 family protein [Acaryochloris sp. IP29b_bin.137]